MLSPYIRHNLLTLQEVWDAVETAPSNDREKFRDELLWQEYARHLYARIGVHFFENLRFEQTRTAEGDGWNRDMACIDMVVNELETDARNMKRKLNAAEKLLSGLGREEIRWKKDE